MSVVSEVKGDEKEGRIDVATIGTLVVVSKVGAGAGAEAS
jgi:hypothetical protein